MFRLLSYLGLLLLSFLSLCACNDSVEERIKDGLEKYAQFNFDDPSSLEFVAIDKVDTLSTTKIKNDIRNKMSLSDSLSVLHNRLCDSIVTYMNIFKAKGPHLKGMKDAWTDYESASIDYKSFQYEYFKGLLNDESSIPIALLSADSISRITPDTALIITSVKYRIRTSDGFKLNIIKCYSDSCYNHLEFAETTKALGDTTIANFLSVVYYKTEYLEKDIKKCRDVIKKLRRVLGVFKDNS